MKSETHLSAKIQEDGRLQVDFYGPADELLLLLEEEACAIFKDLKDKCCSTTYEVMCMIFANIAERVFPDDL